MGLLAHIFRHGPGDASNGGISRDVEAVTIVNLDGPFEPSDDAPAVIVEKGRATPVDRPFEEEQLVGPMWGGTFIYTSDSRFVVETWPGSGRGSRKPLPLFDRFETPAQNEILST